MLRLFIVFWVFNLFDYLFLFVYIPKQYVLVGDPSEN
jgi:hypothetical protein